jgi:hypothetical protein
VTPKVLASQAFLLLSLHGVLVNSFNISIGRWGRGEGYLNLRSPDLFHLFPMIEVHARTHRVTIITKRTSIRALDV